MEERRVACARAQATPLIAGLSVAAVAYASKQAVQLFLRMKAAPPIMKPFYKVGTFQNLEAPPPLNLLHSPFPD